MNAANRLFSRWSLGLVVLLAAVAGGVAWWLIRNAKPAAAESMPIELPDLRERPRLELPAVTFTDVTKESGVDFIHISGAEGEKLLPETMGGGCAVLDYDGDGRQDLLLVGGQPWPWSKAAGSPRPSLRLYHNEGGMRFKDVTAGSGLDVPIYGMGVAVGDYDNDGRVDVYVTAVGRNHLFHNEGNGRFRDVTESAGVGGRDDQWSTSAGWVDYNNDGKLDLFVCNYVRWSRKTDLAQGFQLTGIGRAYGPPVYFEGTHPYLFRNDGNGHFTEVSREAGLHVLNPATRRPIAKSLGVTFLDVNGDGRIDILVANDTVQNFLFLNEGAGRFREIGAEAGMGFDNSGAARGAMGIDAAKFRNDDTLAVAVSNFANEMMGLYVSQGDPLVFADEAIPAGAGPVTRLDLSFGLCFFDYDLDGRLDLFLANGHLEEEIHKVQTGLTYRQPPRLFWNAGADQPSELVSVPAARCGSDVLAPSVGRGVAYADFDGDGDLDLVLMQNNGPTRILRNNAERAGNHWLRFKLIGTQDNRDAIGAWIEVDLAGRTLRRQVMPTRSYLAQVELPVTIGLGKTAQPGAVRIRWQNGKVQPVANPVLEGLTTVRQAE